MTPDFLSMQYYLLDTIYAASWKEIKTEKQYLRINTIKSHIPPSQSNGKEAHIQTKATHSIIYEHLIIPIQVTWYYMYK